MHKWHPLCVDIDSGETSRLIQQRDLGIFSSQWKPYNWSIVIELPVRHVKSLQHEKHENDFWFSSQQN